MSFDFRNTNTLWASVLVGTLVRLGLKTAVVSPGSRSAPLTLALASHPQVEALPILDERSAAFFALGLAKRTGCPSLLVCTSGTAAAHYYPAVIEARESQVPLLVLSADRPPQLRHCASGQTIDQQKLFGDFPNWYAELALPQADLTLLAYLRQTLVQAWHRSLWPTPGPVHLNCPLEDPLAPVADGSAAALPGQLGEGFWRALGPIPGPIDLPGPLLTDLAAQLHHWQGCDRGLIIAGPAQPPHPLPYSQALATLSRALGWPVLAEALSPLRQRASLNPNLVTSYDAILTRVGNSADLVPESVLQVGPLPTSKTLRQWLQRSQPRRWLVGPGVANLDPLHGSTTALGASLEQLAQAAAPLAPPPHPSAYRQRWLEQEHRTRQHLDQTLADLSDLFSGKVPWLMAQVLPPQTPVVIANSLPIREAEWFWPPSDRGLRPLCNRGANGIDGTLSTALGVAHGGTPTVLLTCDLALLHDTNGWLSLPGLRGHLTVVVINNQGGGIFQGLPIAQFDPPFEQFFAMPQRVDLNHLCAAYGVSYERITRWEQLRACLSFLPSRGARVLEVPCDRRWDQQQRQLLLSGSNQALDGD
ncbi:MAG: 2-succinyl-5-enolpyruvyl-6-hydroxy-3-cyclohexene-1-carboxylic-acid synthase [Nodosilinea sp.]